jgi:carboxylesterase type B
MWRDITFTCPAIDFSYNVMKRSNADAWLYELNQTSLGSLLPAHFGVPHISDVPYVFNEVSGSNASASDILLGAQMSGNWSAFSAIGKPTEASVWPVGYPRANFATKSAVSPTEAVINVIGGPYTGPTTIFTQSSEGSVGQQKLLQRCTFLNGIYDELRT